jgi:hypothetical protein
MTIDFDPLHQKEMVHPSWSFQFCDLTPIDAGQFMAPGKLDTALGRKFAALHMVKNDLAFAIGTLIEARKLGKPDSESTLSRALIFAGLISYARPFKTGVREVRLDEEMFATLSPVFSVDLHRYLVDLRDKHIAHSVNEFENSAAISLMVGTADQKTWRVAGIGFTNMNAIGVSGQQVDEAIVQISAMLRLIAFDLEAIRWSLYEAERERFASEGKWGLAPIARFADRRNVSKRRA